MTTETQVILALAAYKIASLAAGVILAYMGYKLFMAGVTGNAGSLAGGDGTKHFELKNAAPGTFFALFGAVVVCFTIFTKLDLETKPTQTTTQTIEINESTQSLPQKPPI